MHPKVQEYLDNIEVLDGKRFYRGSIYLSDLGLTELPFKGITVTDSFCCIGNRLTDLKGAPTGVGGSLYIRDNPITSLKGSPKFIGGDFVGNDLPITSLKGGPETVMCDFLCRGTKITNLEGAPKYIGADLHCDGSPLTSLKGLEEIRGLIFLDKPTNCDYYLQYSLMDKICLV